MAFGVAYKNKSLKKGLLSKIYGFYYRFYGIGLSSLNDWLDCTVHEMHYLYLVFVCNLLTMLAKYWMQSIHDILQFALVVLTDDTLYLLSVTEMRPYI